MLWKLFGVVAVFVLILAGLEAQSVQSQSPGNDRVRVFIEFRNGANPGDVAQVQNLGGQARHSFLDGRIISFDVPAHVADILNQRPQFNVELVPAVSLVEDTLPWGIDRVDAERVWGGADKAVNVQSGANSGAGARVAILDTGIASHVDLNIIGGISYVAGVSSYHDGHGHGTHVAGTVAAKDNGTGVLGIAPGAGLLAVKVLSDSGSGYLDDVAKGIEWAALNGAHAVNMSLSCSGSTACDHEVMRAAMDTALAANVVLVAAAGNNGSGTNTVGWPAQNWQTIAVAATTSSDTRASFSSTGPAVEIAAPGNSIYSTYPGGYATMSGTSMAAPHVAGAVALLVNCGYNGSQIRSVLTSTADDLGAAGRDNEYGYGLLDVDEAANCSGGGATPPAASTVTDGFESGNWSGGSGWLSAWSRAGSSSYSSILTSSGPYEGSRHARLRANAGITRTFSTTGYASGSLTYWAKRNSNVSGSDRVHVEVSTNGSSWTSLYQHSSSNTGTGYQQYSLNLPAGTLNQSTVYLRFRGAMNSSSDYFFLDAVYVGSGGGSSQSNPTATPTNTSVPPTATNSPVPPTATNTSVAPTATNTSVPPTATNTSVPPTATNTPPPTATPAPTSTPSTKPWYCAYWPTFSGC